MIVSDLIKKSVLKMKI